MSKPKKWTEVYPQGTKEGDEEAKFFKALARNPKWDWRSTSAIVKGSGLNRDRVEEIIDKYTRCNPPLIYPHPSNEDHWGYWERDEVAKTIPTDDGSISKVDKSNRIDDYLDGSASVTISAAPLVTVGDDDDVQDVIVISAPAVPCDGVQVSSEILEDIPETILCG